MRSAVSGTIGVAGAGMLAADTPSAGDARPDFVACQDRLRLIGTRAAMAFTREASATVGSSQVLGTMDLGVHGTCRLMSSAHVPFARRTPHRLIKADRLIRAPFTQGRAGRAQPPFPERGVGRGLCPMGAADGHATAATGVPTGWADFVVAERAMLRVRRTVVAPA